MKFYGANLIKSIIDQLPIVDYELVFRFKDEIIPRVLKLSYTSNSVKSFAEALDYPYGPFNWDSNERFILKCELDVIIAYLFQIDKKTLDYMLEYFPIVKQRDIEKYGTYRTKNTILQLFDEMEWVKEEMEKVKKER